jgi:predicted secreted hydrolase
MLLALAGCGPERPQTREALSVGEALSGAPAEGFERALEPRAFAFPADHGPHPGFRTEWWYFTGNLESTDGRRFGFQLTFFRNALAPEPPDSPSAWAARDVWMAHLALTDVESGRFHAFDRFERGALDLAGVRPEPLAVWTGPWRAASTGGETFPLRLQAAQDDVSIDLLLEPAKDLVLQGDRGLSQKGAEPGNASYYYSFTRLATRGTVRTGEDELDVQGSSWLDREWSTSALEAGQVGWDWFALQLADGRELMLYQLRRDDGSPSSESSGTLVAADGTTRHLARDDFRIEPIATWTSPRSGAVYPARWRLTVPSESIELEVRPVLADQELDLAFRYWEGAVDVTGTAAGRGYVELTGYGPAPGS